MKKLNQKTALRWCKRIDYNTFAEVKSLPIFRMSKYKGGFHYDEFNSRRLPFGSLAQRTIGGLYAAKDYARCGLELSFDSVLRGTMGHGRRRKVLNKYLTIADMPPIDGADIVTTIDVQMQDLAERAVVDELKEINGNVGVAIVMEVKTGDIKAIVNMEKCVDGEYRELKNHAVSDLLEPGSVFKTASIMTALNDGVVDTNYVVETGGGVWNMYGRDMKDHNWRRGGYQVINLPRTLEVSSTLGAYETATLFYQQGLKTNEVMEVSTETMKMARIAGMDYVEATNMMTAALRGFNMEINEASAKKVNDVYSELAKITASDTQEISTAMTKTASIAHNANMEFETTAAFLSQIIETTRESAETAGTAMKTIVARFTELKKNPNELVEVDGEQVDANKIETALRSSC